jgi:hypothetical protein
MLLFFNETGVEPGPLFLRPLIGLLYQQWMMNNDNCGAISGMNDGQVKAKYSKEICPCTALSTTVPT